MGGDAMGDGQPGFTDSATADRISVLNRPPCLKIIPYDMISKLNA